MNLTAIVPSPWWLAVGATMLHFVWLGTLIACLGWLVRIVLRHASASTRYVAALSTLLLLAVTPLLEFWVLAPAAARTEAAGSTAAGQLITLVPVEGDAFPFDALLGGIPPKEASRRLHAPPRPAQGLWRTLARWQAPLTEICAYLPWLWLVGSPLVFCLLTTGLMGARRLRGDCALLVESPLVDACNRICAALGITRPVLLGLSERVSAPLVLGIVRPIVLLPPAVLTGCAVEQVEMILWHELAHIRRYDNLVNLLQRVIESLLFYHPAVWIVSGWVRLEREHCCDAVALRHAVSPQAYAETLATLAIPEINPRFAAASMSNHQLVSRIRHILNLEDRSMKVSQKLGLSATGVVLALGLLAMAWAQEPTPPASDDPQPVVASESPSAETTGEATPATKPATAPGAEYPGATAPVPVSSDPVAPAESARELPATPREPTVRPSPSGIIRAVPAPTAPRGAPSRDTTDRGVTPVPRVDPLSAQLEHLRRVYLDVQGFVPPELEKLLAQQKDVEQKLGGLPAELRVRNCQDCHTLAKSEAGLADFERRLADENMRARHERLVAEAQRQRAVDAAVESAQGARIRAVPERAAAAAGDRPREAPRNEAPQSDPPRTDSSRSEPPRNDAPQFDARRSEAPRPETPRFEARPSDTRRTDTPRSDAPRPESPRPESPRDEAVPSSQVVPQTGSRAGAADTTLPVPASVRAETRTARPLNGRNAAPGAPPAATFTAASPGVDVLSLANSYVQALGELKTAQFKLEAAIELAERAAVSAQEVGLSRIAVEIAQQKVDVLREVIQAELESAERRLAGQKAQLDRVEKLVESGAAGQQNLVPAQMAVEQARLQLKILHSLFSRTAPKPADAQ